MMEPAVYHEARSSINCMPRWMITSVDKAGPPVTRYMMQVGKAKQGARGRLMFVTVSFVLLQKLPTA